jgi:tRNA(Ile)-lysidine synthase
MIFLQSLRALSVRDGDRIVVAVSGGADSVCLLHLLSNLARFSLHVAHLNHQFRQEADSEAQFVENLAGEWGLPATIESWPIEALSRQAHLSKQEGARHFRYQFLAACADRIGARWIATGHTADDQAETVLMRLLRGAGCQGLSGIPKIRANRIIRPLLTMTRREIVAELAHAGIPHIEDGSNATRTYLRNRIRHQLLPQIQADHPNIQATLCRTAHLLEAEDDFLQKCAREQMPTTCLAQSEDVIIFDIAKLNALHPAIRRRVLREGLAGMNRFPDPGHLRDVGFAQIEGLMELLTGATGRRWALPAGGSARREYDRLILSRSQSQETPLPPVEIGVLSGTVNLPAWGITFILERTYKPLSRNTLSFDLDRISLPLILRGWQDGDRFVGVGMNGRHKKIQDFFSDAKIPRPSRRRIPLLTCREGILWIVGHRADARFIASEGTKQVLSVEVRSL